MSTRIEARGRVRLLVSGRVQGVFFRAATVEQARALGLHGFACNLADGRVEIVAEGPRAQLEMLAAWARHGPPDARVTEVREEWGESRGEFSGFRVY
jgi:acylphosphatase